jgi:glucose dehydrogenase
MRRSRLALAIILALVGLVWIGQGTAIIKGSSAMTGSSFWAVVGAILIILAVVVLFRERRFTTRS